jgi:hypothetical protein
MESASFIIARMISGQRVRLALGDQAVSGTILMGSDNHKSLLVALDGGLAVAGGYYVGSIPLLMNDNDQYEDLVNSVAIELVWEDA